MDYQKEYIKELEYLKHTKKVLETEIEEEIQLIAERRKKVISSRRQMWQETVHFSTDFTKMTEVNQYLMEVNAQTSSYTHPLKRVEKYRKALDTPYFGRIDFLESGNDIREKIYIGLCNIIDSQTRDIVVYDWRAPISSIFYQYELGEAHYLSPVGPITGEVSLKRQYKIKNSELKYFFDCSIQITDEILQEVLSHNSSLKMKNIVESIQKEQDRVIRDTESELLLVQGVAGSGKTSIALHRIAYLMYQGLNSQVKAQNIIIVSPNRTFSKYISGVLPELGEENVIQITFEDYALGILQEKGKIEGKTSQVEKLINSCASEELSIKKAGVEFKGSPTFVEIIKRFIKYYEHHAVSFADLYYDGKILMTRQELKNLFLRNEIGFPIIKRLKRIEKIIYSRIHPLRKRRLEKIEKLVETVEGHELEIKAFSRLLMLKQAKVFQSRLRKITEVDYFALYKMLFNERNIFQKISQGLSLPDNVEQIIAVTRDNLNKGHIFYEDCAPLLYLKLQLEGSDSFTDIKQVVIDEAQDYSPLQYEIFKNLFINASFTVLGDIHQTIGENNDKILYDQIIQILQKKKSLKLELTKSYRSSWEITNYSQQILAKGLNFEAVQRHGEKPTISEVKTTDELDRKISNYAQMYLTEGFESIAILSKTRQEAEDLYDRLKEDLDEVKLIISSDEEFNKGITIMPIYLAKGLEFDVVVVANVSKEQFFTELDRNLLYIACTRALHRLLLYYLGIKSPFV